MLNLGVACVEKCAVQCAGDVPAAYASLAAFLAAGGTAGDNCDTSLTFSLTSDSDLVGGGFVFKVTPISQISALSHNDALSIQIITVHDTLNPSIACPANFSIQCLPA